MERNADVKTLRAEVERLLAENRSLRRNKDRFGLTFKRHPEQGGAQLLRAGEVPFFTKDHELSLVKTEPQHGEHVAIGGDNLAALVALQDTHSKKVDVVYIDPPYNTGNNDFKYNGRYVHKDDSYRQSKWLSFMERRLVLIKELMNETGILFIALDENGQAPLKMLLDSVFGNHNFMGHIIWERAYSPINLKKHLHSVHDFILVYAKNSTLLPTLSLPRTDAGVARYTNPDNDPRGDWVRNQILVRPAKLSNVYDIVSPSGKVISPPDGYSWRFNPTRFEELVEDGRIYFGKEGNSPPYIKTYLSEVRQGVTPTTIWKHRDAGNASNGSKEFKSILGDEVLPAFPKPIQFISRLINLTNNPNAIVLDCDFFAGSGTTGHAVAALNAEDGGNRQCILISNNCGQPGSPQGIPQDMTANRMHAVLTGQWADGKEHLPLPGNLHYYHVNFHASQELDMEEATTWGNHKYAGIAALDKNSHIVVSPSELDNKDELATRLESGHATILHSDATATLVWSEFDALILEDERVEEAVQQFLQFAEQNNLSPDFLVCSDETSALVPSAYLFAGFPVEAFPLPYRNQVRNTVSHLISQDMLGYAPPFIAHTDVSVEEEEKIRMHEEP